MGVYGIEQHLCPCYKKRQVFQKLLDSKKTGLVVYCHSTKKQDGEEEQEEVVDNTVGTCQDAFILYNTSHVKIISSDIMAELDKKDLYCPRCRKLFEHAQEFVQKIKSIDGKKVMGICDHCVKKTYADKKPCNTCEEVVKKFLHVKGEQKEDTKKYVKIWLEKMRHFLKEPKKIERLAYSDLQINKLYHKSSVSRHEPEIKPMFYSETYKSDLSLHTGITDIEFKEDYKLEQSVDFIEPIEPVVKPYPVTRNEFVKENILIGGPSLLESDITFIETHASERGLPKSTLKDSKPKYINYDDDPSMDVKKAMKIRHDLNLRHIMRLEKGSETSISKSNKSEIYEVPKIASWEQKKPFVNYLDEDFVGYKTDKLTKSPKIAKQRVDSYFTDLKLQAQLSIAKDRHKTEKLEQRSVKPISKHLETFGVGKQFSFVFPIIKKEKREINLGDRSSELIKSTQEKFRLQAEHKLEEYRRKQLAREEKERQAEEKRRQAEEEKRLAEEEKRQAEEKKMQAEEEKRQADEKKRQAEEKQYAEAQRKIIEGAKSNEIYLESDLKMVGEKNIERKKRESRIPREPEIRRKISKTSEIVKKDFKVEQDQSSKIIEDLEVTKKIKPQEIDETEGVREKAKEESKSKPEKRDETEGVQEKAKQEVKSKPEKKTEIGVQEKDKQESKSKPENISKIAVQEKVKEEVKSKSETKSEIGVQEKVKEKSKTKPEKRIEIGVQEKAKEESKTKPDKKADIEGVQDKAYQEGTSKAGKKHEIGVQEKAKQESKLKPDKKTEIEGVQEKANQELTSKRGKKHEIERQEKTKEETKLKPKKRTEIEGVQEKAKKESKSKPEKETKMEGEHERDEVTKTGENGLKVRPKSKIKDDVATDNKKFFYKKDFKEKLALKGEDDVTEKAKKDKIIKMDEKTKKGLAFKLKSGNADINQKVSAKTKKDSMLQTDFTEKIDGLSGKVRKHLKSRSESKDRIDKVTDKERKSKSETKHFELGKLAIQRKTERPKRDEIKEKEDQERFKKIEQLHNGKKDEQKQDEERDEKSKKQGESDEEEHSQKRDTSRKREKHTYLKMQSVEVETTSKKKQKEKKVADIKTKSKDAKQEAAKKAKLVAEYAIFKKLQAEYLKQKTLKKAKKLKIKVKKEKELFDIKLKKKAKQKTKLTLLRKEVPSEKDSELETVTEECNNLKFNEDEITDIIIGENIFQHKPRLEKLKESENVPLLFQSDLLEESPLLESNEIVPTISENAKPARKSEKVLPAHLRVSKKEIAEQEPPKGFIRYCLSDRTFIDKGWTMLPTEKVVRKMNVYRMRPAHPEFDWFKHNKYKRLMTYDTGERLAEIDDNGRGRWYYRNGRLALDYYDTEEVNAQQRFVIYSSGEPDERGRKHPITILATFDYLGNGIVFDHAGKIRLKYNQSEGVLLDRGIGPVSHWKWHTLNDPPVLQQVMIDTLMTPKDPRISQLVSVTEPEELPDNEEMLAIEFDNFINEKSKKLSQKFKPFQIKMKALKINEHFSLRVIDQATIYLIFRDGATNLKLNLGMVLDHQEIVDTDTAEVGDVSNSLYQFPARTDSLAGLQRSLAYAQRYERQRTERDRRLRRPEPCASVDHLTAAASPPLRPPLRTMPVGSTYRKPTNSNLYYNTRLL